VKKFTIFTYDGTSGAPWSTNCGQCRSTVADTRYKYQAVFVHCFRDDVNYPPEIISKTNTVHQNTVRRNQLSIIWSDADMFNNDNDRVIARVMVLHPTRLSAEETNHNKSKQHRNKMQKSDKTQT